MVVTSAHDCTSAYVYPPSGSAPSGLPRCARLDPGSLRKPKFRCAPFSLPSLAPSLRSAKCHLVPRCHCSLTLAWPWLSPLVPRSDSPRPTFATVRIYLTFVRQNPTSFLGRMASLALGTIGLILRHDCVCAYDKILPSLSLLEITGKALFF